MQDCILHIGMPKTGTTSIQSSLSNSLCDRRFRLITLDSYFGDRMMSAAFMPTVFDHAPIFFRGIRPEQMKPIQSTAKTYLDRSLRSATKSGQIPIISAEMIWRFSKEQLSTLSAFLATRGFRPKVYGYIRAPLDMLESSFQQKIKVGRGEPWKELLGMIHGHPFRRRISDLDNVFGRESVDLKYFDPASFPGECVVMDLCEHAGIEFSRNKVVRVNESLNLNAIKFLYAIGRYRVAQGKTLPASMRTMDLLKWQTLTNVLQTVPGPPLRLHSSLTLPLVETFKVEQPAIEKRLRRSAPLTLAVRGNDEGIRSESDLSRFDRVALDWLEDFTGRRIGQNEQGSGIASEIGGMLDRLSLRQMLLHVPAASGKLIRDRIRNITKRNLRKISLYL
jgi:hypothetical protein